MSWSINAAGKLEEVKEKVAEQFKYPLSPAPKGLADEGERETVQRVSELIDQCLGTFGTEVEVIVEASGHLRSSVAGSSQYVKVLIEPKN
jgi:hypothetical protein